MPPSSGTRTLTVLAALARRADRSAAELVAETSLNRATLYRLLDDLEYHGWISSHGTPKRFRLSARFVELGIQALRDYRWRDSVIPAAIQLVADVGLRCSVSVYESGDTVVIDTVRRLAGRTTVLQNGSRAPALVTAAGKVLLAHQSPSHIIDIVNKGVEVLTDYTKQDSNEIHAELAEARQKGFAVADREFHPTTAGVAVPVFDHTGIPVAAMGLSIFPLDRTVLGRVLPLLQEYAERASLELGYRVPVTDGALGDPGIEGVSNL